ncbi:NACHT and ankyrin domain protein [Mycena chlorophos]|uniref:NACHT and ankyrin domain protein n=1 Tax=Mycena chlorophos TaxID=658473 RepID=A0A8H6TKE6_MYCCL|nr:NACHT and ankyrin domain protein [Mycena chlorophos]
MNTIPQYLTIHGGTGGSGGRGGQEGGAGGTGEGGKLHLEGRKLINNIQVLGGKKEDDPDDTTVLNFVSPINFFPQQQEISQTRHQDTGLWLLQNPNFTRWKSGAFRILWCSGIPGAGKTVLA